MTAAEVDIYASYLKGDRVHSQPRKAPAVYKELRAVGIVPFGLSPGTVPRFARTSMTRGALGILETLGITNLDGYFGLNLTGAGVVDAPAGFYPAVAKITLIPANAVANTAGVSAFTGRARNYKGGRSGSVPFGRGSSTLQRDAVDPEAPQPTVGDIDYKDAENGIKTVIGAAVFAGKKRLSFEPELYRAERSEPGFTGDAVAPVF
jgi:hypothetical protein